MSPLAIFAGLEQLTEGVAFVASFCNVIGFATDEGLVVVDTGSPLTGTTSALALRVARRARRERAGAHRRLHARPHRSRDGRERLRGGGPRAGRRAPRHRRPLRPLCPDRRLQRRHQQASVPVARVRVADTVPPPRRDLRARARPRRGRPPLRAPARPRRDRRPHLGLGPRGEGAVHGRPLHLGLPQLRQPAEGSALPARVGRGAPQDGAPRRGAAPARSRPTHPR